MNPPASFTWAKRDVLSWNRISVSELYIAVNLAGAVHRFMFDGRQVEICLPERPPNRPKKSGESWGNDRIRCYWWQAHKPYAFIVEDVDVYVDVQKRLSVPDERVGRVKHDWFDDAGRTKLDKIANSGNAVARGAFEYWLRVLRWKSLHGFIGQRRVERGPSRSAHLVDAKTRQRFYGSTMRLVGSTGNALLSRRHWNLARQALTSTREPPTWLDFLFEGQQRISDGNRHGGVLCLGIAVETVVRTLLKAHLSRPVNQKYLTMVDFVSIGRVLDQWEDLGYWSPSWKQNTDLSKLKRLFVLRNQVAHKATLALDAAECAGIARAVHEFIVHASRATERLARR